MRRSIRFRLALWYALALGAGLSVFALAIWTSMWHSLRSDVHRTMRARLVSIGSFMQHEVADPNERLPEELFEYSQAFPEGTFVQVRSLDGKNLFTTAPKFPWPAGPVPRQGPEVVQWNEHRYRLASSDVTVEGKLWRVTFAESLRRVDEILGRLRWLLLGLIPAVVLLASLGGIWVSRRALKPVDEVTAAAQTIGIQDLSARLIVPRTGDELQRLSETWNGMLERLEDAVSRLSRFTADASHELRTPLAVIRSTAEIAGRRSRSEAAYRAAFASIVHESERMTALIEDLLFLARCDADSLDLPMENVALREMAEDVVAALRPMAEAKNVALRLVAPAEADVWGNRSAMRRLVLILVDNAVKYCRVDGTVLVLIEAGPRTVQLRVQDEGHGIPAAELPFVFQRFYRGMKARDHGNNGFGLGLALANGIAQQHRAHIEVASTSPAGSTFAVALPTAPTAPGTPILN